MGAVTVFVFNCSTFTVCVVVFFCTPTAVLLVVAALIRIVVKFETFEALLYFHLSFFVYIFVGNTDTTNPYTICGCVVCLIAFFCCYFHGVSASFIVVSGVISDYVSIGGFDVFVVIIYFIY